MATGLPDYYRGVDITYQTLSEITNRPKYGGGNMDTSVVLVGANEKAEIIEVIGKGMLYGGSLRVAMTSVQYLSRPILEIDGVEIANLTLYTLDIFGYVVEHSMPMYLLRFNEVEFIYAVGISSGITFETSFRILYHEGHGVAAIASSDVVYALV